MLVPKTEYVEANASRPCPATFEGVIETIKELKSQSNTKVSELESKLQAVTTENEALKAENETLKAKERDRALYYEKYQAVSKELEEIKAVLQAKEDAEKKKSANNQVVPVIDLDSTKSDYTTSESPSDESQETMLFTHPALSLDAPAQLGATDNPGSQPLSSFQLELSGPANYDPNMDHDQSEDVIQGERLNQQQPTTSGSTNPISSDENVREEIISTDAMPETPTPMRRNHRKRSLVEVLEALESDEQSQKRTKTLPQHSPTHFVCSYIPCSYNERFSTMEQYRRHIKDVHPERQFFCSKCPFTTSYQQSLQNHETSHDEHSTFVGHCKLCDVALSKTHLKRHFTWYH